MKKVLFLGVCALFGLTAAAQQSVVKDAERAMKKEANYAEVLKIITPAMSNPETQMMFRSTSFPAKPASNSTTTYSHSNNSAKPPKALKKQCRLPSSAATTTS